MRIGSWKTRSVFERYNIITQADIKDAITKLQVSDKPLKQEQESNFGPRHWVGFGTIGRVSSKHKVIRFSGRQKR